MIYWNNFKTFLKLKPVTTIILKFVLKNHHNEIPQRIVLVKNINIKKYIEQKKIQTIKRLGCNWNSNSGT